MPFGLCNAPATFQSLMNDLLRPYIGVSCLCYLDDVLIFSKNIKEHEKHLREVLTVFRKSQLFANPNKCALYQKKVTFLGHVISTDGVGMEYDKVAAIRTWPTPKNLTELRGFLGLASFYRRHCQSFSKLAVPLTDMLKKDRLFEWTEESTKAFEALKDTSSSAPLLIVPDPNLDYEMSTDASGFAIGAVLSQDQGDGMRPIAFHSRKLNKAETHYPIHDAEMLAIMEALKVFRCYVHGRFVRIFTDHHSLRFFATEPKLNQRQVRWMVNTTHYNYKIEYKSGAKNHVADALSRRADYIPESECVVNAVTTAAIESDFLPGVIEAYSHDPLYSQEDAERPSRTVLESNGTWWMTNSTQQKRLCIPDNQEIREKLLAEAHDTQLSGHLGVNITVVQLKRRFWWPAMAESVADYIRTCGLCQVNKPSSRRKLGLLQPLEIPDRRWGSVSMDQIVELPTTKSGYDSIVVYVDRFTKMMHCQPTHTNVKAPELAKIFFDTVVRLHGLPDDIVLDRDPKFTGHFWRALFKHVGVKLSVSTAYHPQSDGQTERDNRTLESIIRNFVSTNFDNWDTLLPAAEFSYNNSKQKSTQETPFFLNYGMHPVTPLDRVVNVPIDTDVAATTDFLKTIKKANESACAHITTAQRQQRKDTR